MRFPDYFVDELIRTLDRIWHVVPDMPSFHDFVMRVSDNLRQDGGLIAQHGDVMKRWATVLKNAGIAFVYVPGPGRGWTLWVRPTDVPRARKAVEDVARREHPGAFPMEENPVFPKEWYDYGPKWKGGYPEVVEIKRSPETEHPMIRSMGQASHGRHYKYGPVTLSVIAGPTAYSTPRATLPRFEDYEAYEIAMFKDDKWIRPRNIGISFLDDKFEGDPEAGYGTSAIAPYVRKIDVLKLRSLLRGDSRQERNIRLLAEQVGPESAEAMLEQIRRHQEEIRRREEEGRQ